MQNQKKEKTRKAFYDYTGIEIKEPSETEILHNDPDEHSPRKSQNFFRQQIKFRKESDNKEEKKSFNMIDSCVSVSCKNLDNSEKIENLDKKILDYLSKKEDFHSSQTLGEEEKFYINLDRNLKEELKTKSRKLKILNSSDMNNAKSLLGKTKFEKEMEKFQSLIENSIDFKLIKQIKNIDEKVLPSNFYYLAYKEHAKKVQEILKRTCKRMYYNKVYSIDQEKKSLVAKLEAESEKLKSVIQITLPQAKNTKTQSKKKSFIEAKEDDRPLFYLKNNFTNFNEKKSSDLRKITNFSGGKFSNLSNLKRALTKKEINSAENSKNFKSFSNLLNDIRVQIKDNNETNILIAKEMKDIDDIARKDYELIEKRTFHQVESVRDLENKFCDVDKKVKALRTYFRNKKKGKFIIRL